MPEWVTDITAAPRGEEKIKADWIMHDGKGMPVDGETLVNVLYRDGTEATRRAVDLQGTAGDDVSDWVWPVFEVDPLDIVAYRIFQTVGGGA